MHVTLYCIITVTGTACGVLSDKHIFSVYWFILQEEMT